MSSQIDLARTTNGGSPAAARFAMSKRGTSSTGCLGSLLNDPKAASHSERAGNASYQFAFKRGNSISKSIITSADMQRVAANPSNRAPPKMSKGMVASLREQLDTRNKGKANTTQDKELEKSVSVSSLLAQFNGVVEEKRAPGTVALRRMELNKKVSSSPNLRASCIMEDKSVAALRLQFSKQGSQQGSFRGSLRNLKSGSTNFPTRSRQNSSSSLCSDTDTCDLTESNSALSFMSYESQTTEDTPSDNSCALWHRSSEPLIKPAPLPPKPTFNSTYREAGGSGKDCRETRKGCLFVMDDDKLAGTKVIQYRLNKAAGTLQRFFRYVKFMLAKWVKRVQYLEEEKERIENQRKDELSDIQIYIEVEKQKLAMEFAKAAMEEEENLTKEVIEQQETIEKLNKELNSEKIMYERQLNEKLKESIRKEQHENEMLSMIDPLQEDKTKDLKRTITYLTRNIEQCIDYGKRFKSSKEQFEWRITSLDVKTLGLKAHNKVVRKYIRKIKKIGRRALRQEPKEEHDSEIQVSDPGRNDTKQSEPFERAALQSPTNVTQLETLDPASAKIPSKVRQLEPSDECQVEVKSPKNKRRNAFRVRSSEKEDPVSAKIPSTIKLLEPSDECQVEAKCPKSKRRNAFRVKSSDEKDKKKSGKSSKKKGSSGESKRSRRKESSSGESKSKRSSKSPKPSGKSSKSSSKSPTRSGSKKSSKTDQKSLSPAPRLSSCQSALLSLMKGNDSGMECKRTESNNSNSSSSSSISSNMVSNKTDLLLSNSQSALMNLMATTEGCNAQSMKV